MCIKNKLMLIARKVYNYNKIEIKLTPQKVELSIGKHFKFIFYD